MLRPLALLLTSALGVNLFIAVGCTAADVTNVGSVVEDGGGADTPPGFADDASADRSTSDAPDDTRSDAPRDAPADTKLDAPPPLCASGACGTKVCGRDECGNVCGYCPAPGPQGGCFMGACIVDSPGNQCPGTPCVDQNGEHVCEGERGGKACVGGTLGVQVCTCTGGGATAWASCGPCL